MKKISNIAKVFVTAVVVFEVGLLSTIDIKMAVITAGLLIATLRLWWVYDYQEEYEIEIDDIQEMQKEVEEIEVQETDFFASRDEKALKWQKQGIF